MCGWLELVCGQAAVQTAPHFKEEGAQLHCACKLLVIPGMNKIVSNQPSSLSAGPLCHVSEIPLHVKQCLRIK
jgi:hypothetical protein